MCCVIQCVPANVTNSEKGGKIMENIGNLGKLSGKSDCGWGNGYMERIWTEKSEKIYKNFFFVSSHILYVLHERSLLLSHNTLAVYRSHRYRCLSALFSFLRICITFDLVSPIQ